MPILLVESAENEAALELTSNYEVLFSSHAPKLWCQRRRQGWYIHVAGFSRIDSCYENSVRLALEHNLGTIAFPAISTDAYAYPFKLAAAIAISTVKKITERSEGIDEVAFCCFDGEDFAVYKRLLRAARLYSVM